MKQVVLSALLVVSGAVLGLLGAGAFLQGQGQPPAAVPRELTSYRDVVRKVLPAVASIEIRGKGARAAFDPDERPRETPQGFGSGFVVDPKGYVLTNNHVVEGADQVEVTLTDGRKFVSKDIKTDPKTDLALVKIDNK